VPYANNHMQTTTSDLQTTLARPLRAAVSKQRQPCCPLHARCTSATTSPRPRPIPPPFFLCATRGRACVAHTLESNTTCLMRACPRQMACTRDSARESPRDRPGVTGRGGGRGGGGKHLVEATRTPARVEHPGSQDCAADQNRQQRQTREKAGQENKVEHLRCVSFLRQGGGFHYPAGVYGSALRVGSPRRGLHRGWGACGSV